MSEQLIEQLPRMKLTCEKGMLDVIAAFCCPFLPRNIKMSLFPS